jgi:D-alanine-D-alanine ligase
MPRRLSLKEGDFMVKVLLITGPAGGIQGWGNLETTINIRKALIESGKDAKILYVNSMNELITGLETWSYDIVWSSLYHLSQQKNYVGTAVDELWIADILQHWDIPYIGPTAQTMKNLIDKAATIEILKNANVSVHEQNIVNVNEQLSKNSFPWFVKPRYESESTGISERSVVNSNSELSLMVKYIHETFHQPALVEEYLPGKEYTVIVLGNGTDRKILPVINIIEESAFVKYPLVTIDAKINNQISFKVPDEKVDEAISLASAAADVLDCFDHVRIDIREDKNGNLKIMEVNGIPGLNPIKSRSLHIYEDYYPECPKEESFGRLVNAIVDSAIHRYNALPQSKRRLYIKDQEAI